jgi:hypothetical protein
VSITSRVVAPLVTLALAGLPVLLPSPASATSSAGLSAAAIVPCLTDVAPAAARTAADDEDAPRWREHPDHKEVTQSDLDALPPVETTRRFHAREVEPRLASRIWIPVYVHVIKGTHKGERVPTGPKRVKRLLRILNLGMAGDQSGRTVNTRYRFKLRKIDYTKRDGWYHAYFNGPRDKRMKKKLHRGNSGTLNLYINGGGPKGVPVLGWSRFPWQYRSAPYLDGVSVNHASMPGGKARGYNLGDTVIHETGHWLGLFHTFQGGCGTKGDLVADTHEEDEPSYFCETTRDTCPAPGLDPVRNFMDYSRDSCMNHFTPGQAQRIDSAYEKWRS